jgi:uncharacterized protein with PQ loop repeat
MTDAPMFLTLVGGALVTLLGVVVVAPQALKVWRSRSAAGVATSMWQIVLFVSSVWVGLGVREGDIVILISSTATLPAATVVVLGILRADGWPVARGVRTMATCAVAIAGGLMVGLTAPVPLVASLMILGPCAQLPQIRASWRARAAHSPSQVALTTWWLSLTANVLWVALGASAGSTAVMLAAFVGVAIGSVVLALEYSARLRNPGRPAQQERPARPW